MKLTPEPYQQLMRGHLLAHERAGAFVGVGLGKTVTTLLSAKDLMADGACRAMLVVAPLRVAQLTWPNEIAKWDDFAGWRVESLRDGHKPSGRAQVYTCNYESLHKIADLSFVQLVVFDEITRAKNPQSERINSFRPKLTPDLMRWGLTGTPRPNSLLELFAQIRLLDDGKRLGPSFSHFRSTWFTPEDYMEYRWNPKPNAARRIYEKISDLVITLRSSDYLDIPDTIVEDIEVPLPKDAHAIYRQLERELLAVIGTDEVLAVNAAVLVNKLLQVCGGTIYGLDRKVLTVHAGKINALKRLLVDINEPAIIACNYIHERERVVACVPGAVDASKFKGDIEDAWNSGAMRYLVADPRSLGHGLNLQTGGRNIVWFSPCWSRELFDQMNGRVARKGQQLVPRVYRLTCPGTIDDAVVEALRTRGDEQTEMLAVLHNFRIQGLTFL